MRGLVGWAAAGLLALGATMVPQPAAAVFGASDNTPAATVLIPYFEVDLASTNGRNTLLSLTNTSASAALANVVLWSDQGIPTASFNLYLTGYDMQSISVRDLLAGIVPRTASAGQDPSDGISPKGQLSQDINFASCTGTLPYAAAINNFSGPTATPPTPADVRAMLTGQASTVTYPGQCVGAARGDNVARGYITIDSIVACTGLNPGDAGYQSVIDTRNILTGDFYLVNPGADIAMAAPAVSIEATNATAPAGSYRFYGASNGFSGVDNREPLPTNWRAGAENAGSELLVWRDPKVKSLPHACGAAPTYGNLPIGDNAGVSAFGTETTYYPISGGAAIAPNVSQRIPVASTPLTGLPASKLAWLNLSFNHGIPAAGGRPLVDPLAASSYVVTLRSPENTGVFNLAVPATALDSGLAPNHQHPRP